MAGLAARRHFPVPSGGSIGPTATGAFCSAVRVGGRIYTAVTSPIGLLLIIVGLVGGVIGAARSTGWSPRVPRPLRRVRSAGQILTAAKSAYAGNRSVFLWLGALFLPAAIVETAAQTLVLGVTRLGSLVDVAGEHSLLSAAAALLVAGAGHVLAAVIVYGGVAASLSAAEVGPAPGVRETYRLLGTRIRDRKSVV